jgi:uncharacterized protein (DUF2235 family)
MRSGYPRYKSSLVSPKSPSMDQIVSMSGKAAHDDSHDVHVPGAWHHTSTDEPISRSAVMSPFGSEKDFPSRQPIEDILASMEASTLGSDFAYSEPSHTPNITYTGSQARQPPSSVAFNHNDEQQDETDHDTQHYEAFSWRRGLYPLHEQQSEHVTRPAVPSSSMTDDSEQLPQYVSSADDTLPARSLRRSPGSERLGEVLKNASNGFADFHATRTDTEEPPDLKSPQTHPDADRGQDGPHTWKRGLYPLQHVNPSNTERSSSLINAGPPAPNHGTKLQREATPPQAMNSVTESAPDRLPASPPSSEDESIITDRPPAYQASPSEQVAGGMNKLGRRTYPLQSPASSLNLRRSPTPPPSPDRLRESGDVNAVRMKHDASGDAGHVPALRRNRYPLQSPASSIDLKSTAGDPAKVLNSTVQDDTGSAESKPESQRRPSKYKRQIYPLQSPASNLDLRQASSDTADIKNLANAVRNLSQREHDKPKPKTKISLRRGLYPLQSSASIVNLQQPTSLAPILETVPSNTGSPVTSNSGAPSEGPSITDKTPRTNQYPLQSKASIPSLHVVPPSPAIPAESTQIGLPDETAAPAESTEVNLPDEKLALAAKVLKTWRRQVYPLQSADGASPFSRATTPLPSVEEKKLSTGPLHLPRNMQAVNDAVKDTDTKGRTIVVCLDGTGDKFDDDNSNIVHLISALKKDDKRQVSYYQAGIGTYSNHGLSTGFSAALDMAVGFELGMHVRDAYQFLMHTYKEGDKICLFGFSRGAYTARCLAGMIHKVGLLPPRNLQQIPFAYEFYSNDTPEGWQSSRDFKATFSIDVNVYFLGCFDSVASVGFIPRQLPLSSTPTNKARYFRHAMALDERRAKFKVCRHQSKKPEDVLPQDTHHNGTGAMTPPSPSENSPTLSFPFSLLNYLPLPSYTDSQKSDDPPAYNPHTPYGPSHHPNVTDEEYTHLTNKDPALETDVLEVWFAGCHADVGGGAMPNSTRHKLAQIPLRWMIRQCFAANTGIIFKTRKLAEFGLDVHRLWPSYEALSPPSHGPPPSFLDKFESGLPSREGRGLSLRPVSPVPTATDNASENKASATSKHRSEKLYAWHGPGHQNWTPEQVEDFYDAMAPINDQLIQAPKWWILEAWPVQYKVPGLEPGTVELRTGMNLGRYRGVEDREPNLHWTVRMRERYLAGIGNRGSEYGIGAGGSNGNREEDGAGYQIRVRISRRARWNVVA